MGERLYVLGHPVAHSKSPVMHAAAYRALGLDWEYGFEDCASPDEARVFLCEGDWLALNVTMPYKPLALEVADAPTAEALLARGANVLVRRRAGTGAGGSAGAGAGGSAGGSGRDGSGRDGSGRDGSGRDGLFADNTDGRGCVSYLQRCGVNFVDAAVAVCGTGPTSLAIMHAAASAGAARVTLLGRDGGRAQRALGAYSERVGAAGTAGTAESAELKAGSYGDYGAEIQAADVILDATPLGMKPGDPAPFDTSLLAGGHVVFDVVYGHGTTALAAAAEQAGCRFYDGSGMLVAQAAETVRDIARVTGAFAIPDDLDLFAIMSDAAGFKM